MSHKRNSSISTYLVLLSILLLVVFLSFNIEELKSITRSPYPTQKSRNQQLPTKESAQESLTSSGLEYDYHDNDSEPIGPKGDVQDGGEEEGRQWPPIECDLFDGSWVLDNETMPLYKEEECEFLTQQVTCLRNGRKDSLYQNWRWQPSSCSLPKFEASLFLKKLTNKRLMFVGDSLNRNQWESMVCLLHSGFPSSSNNLNDTGTVAIFKIQEFDATIEYYWAPFLVESNSDDPAKHSILDRIIMAESIEKHGANWKDVDYLIFNTYIWWLGNINIKVLRGSFDEGSTEYDEIEHTVAYDRALKTWSKWVKSNVDPNHTTVFFNSMSPNHFNSSFWNNPDGVKCAKETTPISRFSLPLEMGTDRRLYRIAKNVIGTMNVHVHFMEITTLSEYRKDAHTSIFTTRQGKLLTPEQQADPRIYADCIHWCLPGLPDTWNQFIYTRIMSQ